MKDNLPSKSLICLASACAFVGVLFANVMIENRVAPCSVDVLADMPKPEVRQDGSFRLPISFWKGRIARWDFSVACNLELADGVAFDIKCDDLAPFSSMRFYFKSGENWCSAEVVPSADGSWKHVSITKPRGQGVFDWSKVVQLRLAGEPSGLPVAQNAAIHIRNLCMPGVGGLSGKPGERRLFWCHHPWGMGGTNDWESTIAALEEIGFTDVIANLSTAGVAWYDSKILPSSPEVAQKGDALELCRAACKRHGIRLHVWKVCWKLGSCCEKLAELRSAGRTQKTRAGADMDWLCPSDPENTHTEVKAFVELADKCVDGIHFDYQRFPDGECCYCEGCRRRFARWLGVSENLVWKALFAQPDAERKWIEFRKDCITRVVRSVSEIVRRKHPNTEISLAARPSPMLSPEVDGQDWPAWCRENLLDFICPMDYTAEPEFFRNLVRGQQRFCGNVKLYPGIGLNCWDSTGRDVQKVFEHISIVRELGCEGFSSFNFTWRSLQAYKALARGLKNEACPACVPSTPRHGAGAEDVSNGAKVVNR